MRTPGTRVAIDSKGPRTFEGAVRLRVPGLELAGPADKQKEDHRPIRQYACRRFRTKDRLPKSQPTQPEAAQAHSAPAAPFENQLQSFALFSAFITALSNEQPSNGHVIAEAGLATGGTSTGFTKLSNDGVNVVALEFAGSSDCSEHSGNRQTWENRFNVAFWS